MEHSTPHHVISLEDINMNASSGDPQLDGQSNLDLTNGAVLKQSLVWSCHHTVYCRDPPYACTSLTAAAALLLQITWETRLKKYKAVLTEKYERFNAEVSALC